MVSGMTAEPGKADLILGRIPKSSRKESAMRNAPRSIRIYVFPALFGLLTLISTTGGTQVNVPGGVVPSGDPDENPSTTVIKSREHKQQKELLKSQLKNMRKDAAEMAELAASIQSDLDKTTENELPLRVVSKAEQVEKLAKRIKNTAKGF